MLDVMTWVALLVAALGALAAAAYVVRGGTGPGLTSAFFRPKSEPRIEVVEQAAMDGKRRLVLIRRDDIEHLLLTGGPVDVVIETGIQPPAQVSAEFPQPDYGVPRPARGFGARTAESASQPPPLGRAASGVMRLQEPELPSPDVAPPIAERA